MSVEDRIRRVARPSAFQSISRVPRPSFAWAGVFVDDHKSFDWDSGLPFQTLAVSRVYRAATSSNRASVSGYRRTSSTRAAA
jgi:hypothetical protein